MATLSRQQAAQLGNAVALQRAGQPRKARRILEAVLRQAPAQPDALHLLGLACLDTGEEARGLTLLRAAVAARPDYAEARNNLAIELARRGAHAEAAEHFAHALALRPDEPLLHLNHGRALHALGRIADALAAYDRALAHAPGHAEAWNQRGIALAELGNLPAALASQDRALALDAGLAAAWTNRGLVLHRLGRLSEALQSLERAATLGGDDGANWDARAAVLRALHRHEDALAAIARAEARDGRSDDRSLARAGALLELRRLDEARAACAAVLARDSGNATAWSLHGACLHHMRRDAEAMASIDRALALRPDDADTRLLRGYALLAAGSFAEGWAEAEYRLRRAEKGAARPEIGAPDWDGGDPAGRHLLIYTEQGRGDAIQFARYLPLLAARGARLSLLAPADLHALLATACPGMALIDRPEQVEGVDAVAALLSLPFLFGTDLATIPASVPYLAAAPARVARWRAHLGGEGLRVGIAWQGNPRVGVDIGRSFPLAHYRALAALAGVRLISLQKHAGSEQLAALPEDMRVETLGEDFDAGPDAFLDSAAAMQSLDLVISSDTAIAHLAGALGRPVWVALQFVPDWRWLRDRADSPWYPSMRLFRQAAPGDWAGVFAAMRDALAPLAAARKGENA